MTLTYPALNRAAQVLWLVTGGAKREALARLLRGDPSIPAGRVQRGGAVVVADRAAAAGAETGRPAPENMAGVQRLPRQALVYELRNAAGQLDLVILPISGMGLWSTLYGFIALDADLETIRGITYYEHLETPGLGGEVDNPRWKALWPGRKAFDDDETVSIEVIRGRAGAPEDDPHRVDGLAGATMTSRGVTNMLQLWLGEHGFRPYLDRLRSREGA